MAANSTIEWTNSTWNPVTGCTKVSSGCDNCYAERLSERFRGVAGHPFEMGFDLTLRPERLDQPKRWRRPRLVFVNSMSDLFHKNIPDEYVARVFETMEAANWHVYQVLTKRSSLMRDFIARHYRDRPVPSHIWLGVSIENDSASVRLVHLKQTNASVRFVSFEPLLGPVGPVDLRGIHWAIAGGESGPGARPVKVEWLRGLRDVCQEQGVAFFFKQWGGRTPKAGGNWLDDRQWLEYPAVDAIQRVSQPLAVAGSPLANNDKHEPMGVGPWVQEKLKCLAKYLDAYTTILSKQRQFKGFFYIDAFAGPGSLQIRRQQENDIGQQSLLEVSQFATEDTGRANYIHGSPRVALSLEKPFTHYVFIEIDQQRIQQLESLKTEFTDREIFIRESDCNKYLVEFLEKTEGRWGEWRGVVFLDPFGMQVPWETIERIGKTRAIEVIINFPVGMAIQRLLKNSGNFTDRQRRKLDAYFGTDEWFNLLYRTEDDLFGGKTKKVADASDVLVKWYRRRLKEAFGYVTMAREVQSTTGRPLYYLIFAGPNKTGAKIAGHVLMQGARQIR